ncbi:Flavanone 3-dioxygenase [Bertholletia excelsa]
MSSTIGNGEASQPLEVPIVDLSLLHQSSSQSSRSLVIQQIHQACLQLGCFQIINHGINEMVMEEAMEVNSEFFKMPMEYKEEFISDDINKPVRFNAIEGSHPEAGKFLRHFLKLYAHPLPDFLPCWPAKPPNYRDKMGIYAKEVKKLGTRLLGVIMESLKLGPTYLRESFDKGFQVVAVNGYPPSSQTDINMGIPPHTDHSIITILLQSCSGLHARPRSGEGAGHGDWMVVPEVKGALVVLVGDHLEVLSNGLYKSVVHQAAPSRGGTRFSIASLHSLAMEQIVEPAPELVDDEHPTGYEGSSLRDYLDYLSSKKDQTYIENLKLRYVKENNFEDNPAPLCFIKP